MKYISKNQAISLTNKHKYNYPLFNIFQLELNRLANLSEYKILSNEIISFNKQLDDWKKRNIDIKNLFITYNLYQNLFDRMKYTSNLIIDREQAKTICIQLIDWFYEQKPKIRNKLPDKQSGQLKPSTADKQYQQQLNGLLINNRIKRQLKVYQSIDNKTYNQFYNHKEQLLQYNLKDSQQNKDLGYTKRALSVNNIAKLKRYKGSYESTMTTLRKTTSSIIKTSRIQPIISPFDLKELQTKYNQQFNQGQLYELQREKVVVQSQFLQQNIKQNKHQQDDDQNQEIIFQEDPQHIPYKKYKYHHRDNERMICQENIKDVKQSTLRRIINQKQENIRSKMEDLNIVKNMENWASIKGRFLSQKYANSQRKMLGNKYSSMKFIPTTFQQKQLTKRKNIPQYSLLNKNKSFQSIPIEKQVQKQKLTINLKKYGKYINHIQIKPISLQNRKSEQMRLTKATSLTNFFRQQKRSPFSKLMDLHGVKKYNEDAYDNVTLVKQRLAKRAISIDKKHLLNAFSVVDFTQLDRKIPFPHDKKLLSNPFFPKQLNKSKKKKK